MISWYFLTFFNGIFHWKWRKKTFISWSIYLNTKLNPHNFYKLWGATHCSRSKNASIWGHSPTHSRETRFWNFPLSPIFEVKIGLKGLNIDRFSNFFLHKCFSHQLLSFMKFWAKIFFLGQCTLLKVSEMCMPLNQERRYVVFKTTLS